MISFASSEGCYRKTFENNVMVYEFREMCSSKSEIPIEIVIHIFAFLDIKGIAKLSCCSKSMRGISLDSMLLKTHFELQGSQPNPLLPLFERSSNFPDIDILSYYKRRHEIESTILSGLQTQAIVIIEQPGFEQQVVTEGSEIHLKQTPFYITFVFPHDRGAFLYAKDITSTPLPFNLQGYITGGADKELYGNHVLMLSRAVYFYQDEDVPSDYTFDYLEETDSYAVCRSMVTHYQEREFRKELSEVFKLELRFQIQAKSVLKCKINFEN